MVPNDRAFDSPNKVKYLEFWIKSWHCGMVIKSFEPIDYGVYTQYIFLFLLWKWLTFDYILLEGNLDDKWFAWLIFSDKRLLIRGTCSTWSIFSDKLSPYHQGNMFHLIDFPRQAVYSWGDKCSTWVIFPDTLSQHGEKKDIFNWFLVLISCRFERLKKWLTNPFMVFPYKVRGENQFFVTI